MSSPDPSSAFSSIQLATEDLDQAQRDYERLLGVDCEASVDGVVVGLTNLDLLIEPRSMARAAGTIRSATLLADSTLITIGETEARSLSATAPEHVQRQPVSDQDQARLVQRTGATRFSRSAVHALDHLVIQSKDVDGTRDFYEKVLGLRVLFDREFEKWNMRLCMLRVGDAVLEIAGKLGEQESADGPEDNRDHLWGITWRCQDIEATHSRLVDLEFDVSSVRTGRKPGSRVFTVRSQTQGVPTLLIQHGAS